MVEINPKEYLKNIDKINNENELKLLAMHFSPKRTDCVDGNFTYKIIEGKIYTTEDNIDLTDEIKETTWNDLAIEYFDYPNARKSILNILKNAKS